jgi:glycosyltransferase involved in cell wall biosynthesis
VSIGTFTIVKNEGEWIAAHVLRALPVIDEMVFFDGNSTDGTLEIIRAIRDTEPGGHKIKLFENRDPNDLQDDYVRVFNDCLREVKSDYAFFAHPDMWLVDPAQVLEAKKKCAVAMSVKLRSFAGEPDGPLFEIKGRGERWKSIHATSMGLVYHGHYGAWNEDVYPTAIVGDSREFHGDNFTWYPYGVEESGIELLHFSDVRPYPRRLGRMVTCLMNQGKSNVVEQASIHPRVTLKDGAGFKFVPAKYPEEFLSFNRKYAPLRREPACI